MKRLFIYIFIVAALTFSLLFLVYISNNWNNLHSSNISNQNYTACSVIYKNATNNEWSGYVFRIPPNYRVDSINTTFIVPQIYHTNQSNTLQDIGFWIGVLNKNAVTLNSIHPKIVQVGIIAQNQGSSFYDMFYELLPQKTNTTYQPVYPGNKIFMQITLQNQTTMEWNILINDTSQKNDDFNINTTFSMSVYAVAWIAEPNGLENLTALPPYFQVANFTKNNLKLCNASSCDSYNLSKLNAQEYYIDLASNTNNSLKVNITPSILSSNGFSICNNEKGGIKTNSFIPNFGNVISANTIKR